MARFDSQGKCNLCGKTFKKPSMSRHLAKCVTEFAEPGVEMAKTKMRKAQVQLLQAEGRWNPVYWLFLEIPVDLTLADLDQFLRRIWLECCGHMSQFTIGGRRYSVAPDPEWSDEAGMEVRVGNVLTPGTKLTYEYDFGSTTELVLKVVSEYEGVVGKKPLIRVLARNDPPPIMCGVCKKEPAALIDMENSYEATGWLCAECAKQAEVDEEMCLPVVNSPRTGVCGYTG